MRGYSTNDDLSIDKQLRARSPFLWSLLRLMGYVVGIYIKSQEMMKCNIVWQLIYNPFLVGVDVSLDYWYVINQTDVINNHPSCIV